MALIKMVPWYRPSVVCSVASMIVGLAIVNDVGLKVPLAIIGDAEIDDILGEWIDFNPELDASKQTIVSVFINGETLISDIPFWNEPGGDLHIKFGIYRPGNFSGNTKSTVDYDSINVN